MGKPITIWIDDKPNFINEAYDLKEFVGDEIYKAIEHLIKAENEENYERGYREGYKAHENNEPNIFEE